MNITYPPELLPTPDEGEGADVFVQWPIEVTPEMIDAGAAVLEPFDRLELSPSYARQLAEEIIEAALRTKSKQVKRKVVA